ncbi:MAG: cyclodeaminase/cyclohydrolase family protein [Bacteroidetes bacterium]|jgi:formiminotetrahydrofolate cyclodeaminase|nr:cyclodeaminase/cyclohydrolase family protein [Bacteroidota bacterium]
MPPNGAAMLIHQTVSEFLDTTASSSPAPGGGSVSALAGALGAALTSMVCRLTIGKKKYAAVEADMQASLAQSEALRNQFLSLIDQDTAAFNGVMAAFGLPKETDEQRSARESAIHDATRQATLVPLELMRTLQRALPFTAIVAEKGNKNSASDAGVAALLIGSAARGAALNVYVNLSGLPENAFRRDTEQETRGLEQKIVTESDRIAATVRSSLTGAS